ncbi:hypothetical protein [Leptospira weilii]|nr:hypothetical protein [Leptospira weilii]OMI13011.1 hypothetical protein BUQ74_21020 [Leptospira weilii serovar Heyan]ULH29074.1 hypothetical protein FH586_03825 [Leptospira weilii]UPY79322.1 hypothetical protein FH581_010920 [Leptospira weilii]
MSGNLETISYIENLRDDEVQIIRKQLYNSYSNWLFIVILSAITFASWHFQIVFYSAISMLLLVSFIVLYLVTLVKIEQEIKEGKKLVIKGKIQNKEVDRIFKNKVDRQGKVVSSYFIIEKYKIEVPRKEFSKYSCGQSVEIHKLPKSSLILKIANLSDSP